MTMTGKRIASKYSEAIVDEIRESEGERERERERGRERERKRERERLSNKNL